MLSKVQIAEHRLRNWFYIGWEKVSAIDIRILAIAALAAIAIVWWKAGIFTSGYHLVDDHELLRIHADLAQIGLADTISKWVSNDLLIRFRPVYYTMRVLSVQLFGLSFLAYYIFNFAIGFVSAALTFKALRKLGADVIIGIFLTAFVFIGQQTAIWWRLGPAELWGFLFLSFSFYKVTSYRVHGGWWRYLLAFVFALLAAGTKEAFLLALPFIAMLTVNLQAMPRSVWFRFLATSAVKILPYFIAFSTGVYLIYSKIGLNTIGYAGVGESTWNIARLVRTTISYWPLELAATAILLAVVLILHFRKLSWAKLLPAAWVGLAALVLLAGQTILYATSGVFERYLLPGMLGPVVIIAAMYGLILGLGLSKLWIVRVLIVVLFIIGLLKLFPPMYAQAKAFALDGRELNNALQLLDDKTEPDDYILLVAHPESHFEYTFSFQIYLNQVLNMYNILIVDANDNISAGGQGLVNQFETFKKLHIEDVTDHSVFKVIWAFPMAIEGWAGQKIATDLISSGAYTEVYYAGHRIYYK